MRCLLFLVVTTCLFVVGCVKPDGARQLAGGKGGKSTVRAFPYNGANGMWLHKATVYIEYASWQAPADGQYDDSVECVKTDTMITAVFTGLRPGDYYLYARGYDSSGSKPTYLQGGTQLIFESEGTYTVNVGATRP